MASSSCAISNSWRVVWDSLLAYAYSYELVPGDPLTYTSLRRQIRCLNRGFASEYGDWQLRGILSEVCGEMLLKVRGSSLYKVACIDPFTESELELYVSEIIAFFVDPAVDAQNSSVHLEQFGKVFVWRMEDQAVQTVKKDLEAFLTQALYDRKMFKRETTYTQRKIDDRSRWVYVLPVQVLQEYVVAGEALGYEFP